MKRSAADCSKNDTDNDNIKFTAQEGHLTSPGYPEYFTDNIQCTWYIAVARRYSIELEFEFFDFGRSQPCSAESEATFLEVRDGSDTDSKTLGLFYGKTKPEKTSSSGREMRIRFKANGYRSAKFKAKYRAVKGKASSCNVSSLCVARILVQTVSSLNGRFSLPFYWIQITYINGFCVWPSLYSHHIA